MNMQNQYSQKVGFIQLFEINRKINFFNSKYLNISYFFVQYFERQFKH